MYPRTYELYFLYHIEPFEASGNGDSDNRTFIVYSIL